MSRRLLVAEAARYRAERHPMTGVERVGVDLPKLTVEPNAWTA